MLSLESPGGWGCRHRKAGARHLLRKAALAAKEEDLVAVAADSILKPALVITGPALLALRWRVFPGRGVDDCSIQ